MENEIQKAHSLPSIRRLPLYLNFLKGVNDEFISGTVIAEALDLQPIQVRKDLSITSIVGKPKTGFHVVSLIRRIESFLGWDNVKDAFLIGVGHFGRALMGYREFKEHGLNIVAVFDNDIEKIGKEILGHKILSIEKLPNLLQRMKVKIGIITSSGKSAQAITDVLVNNGILGIWNFTTETLSVPKNVVVENVRLVSSLSVLTNKLSKVLTNNHKNKKNINK